MTNLNERLRGIDRLTPPDLWEAARIRAERGTAIPPTPSPTRRFAIIAASLTIGLAAVGLVIFAFRSDPPTTPVTPVRRAVANGDIWVKVGGGDGATAIYRVDPGSVRDSTAMWTDSGGTFGDTQVAPRLIADDYAFSPDGGRVVFSAQGPQGNGEVPRELFVMNADGTGLGQLTNDGAYAGFPAWSPDGNTIVYASYRGNEYIPGCLGLSICATDLYVIDADGGTPSPVATGDASETTPSWSPDGSRIAFSEVSDGGAGTIVTMRADGSDRVVLQSAGDVSFPSWSPDGTQIAFLRMQGGTNHLWTVSPDGSVQSDIVDTLTDTNFGRPVWSPEGDHIAFARPYAGVVSLWIIDRAGNRSPERIAGWPGFDGSPIAWRPIPVQRESDTENVSLLVSSSGPSGDQALLTGTLTAEDGCLAVSTGTSSIYVVWPAGYSLSEEKGDTWLADDSGTLVARIGDEIQMGGGITNLAHAEPEVVGGIPSSCEVGGPDAYWFAGTTEVVEPSPSEDSTAIAARAEIVCRADGSTNVLTPTVRARPDGVHVFVRSQLDEPASVNGIGVDVSPGRWSDVLSIEPGTIDVACWAFSQHGKEEPATTPLEVVDPEGMYVDPELACSGGMIRGTISDFIAPAPKDALIPLDEARRQIGGLASDDEVIHGGYPEEATPQVLVVRDEAVIASISFGLSGTDWVHMASSVCDESGLRV